MSSKNNAEVIIDGKIFTLSGYESEEYLQKVAAYINNKITEFKQNEGYRRQPVDVQKALLDLNIADDYFKAKKQADSLETELESKDKQLYDIKHELINAQINNETLEKERDELKEKLSEAQKEQIRYETIISEMKEKEKKEKSDKKSQEKEQEKTSKKQSSKQSEKNYHISKPVDLPVNVINDEKITRTSEADKILSSLDGLF